MNILLSITSFFILLMGTFFLFLEKPLYKVWAILGLYIFSFLYFYSKGIVLFGLFFLILSFLKFVTFLFLVMHEKRRFEIVCPHRKMKLFLGTSIILFISSSIYYLSSLENLTTSYVSELDSFSFSKQVFDTYFPFLLLILMFFIIIAYVMGEKFKVLERKKK